ncbi:hypothetical protein [Agromyces sp. LHK192]|uniref:hypothetical protein n=1 Tax=Agromyces sp. LHK192 TaxID=2498704 RepID=UPI000FDB265D|nr:hypothetical protein [Agromyces sp. LHK192]
MQLGTRWAFGAEPPRSVPDSLRPRIAAVEQERVEEARGDGGDGRHWTLTWLEGRPIAELDDGTVVRDAPTHAEPGADGIDSDDDW